MNVQKFFKNAAIAAVITTSVAACTSAERKKMGAYMSGQGALIEVRSGGFLVESYVSTGKVQSESNSDGYYFTDEATGTLREVSGDVTISYAPTTQEITDSKAELARDTQAKLECH